MDLDQFESLSPEEQAKVFHKSPFKEKGELLRHSHDPMRLTRSLSQEELYLMAKEMDLEERSEVIRYANLPQLFFISDVDCWKKDRIDPIGFQSWLETLLAADERKLLAWLLEMDYESVVAGFKKLIQVLKPEREYAIDELLGDRPYFTLDENYFILAKEENMESLRRTLEILYENHRGRYVALLEDVMAGIDDEVEEDAFQRREMRLAERGFPDFETARKIYRLMSKQEFEAFPLKKQLPSEKDVKKAFPNYPVLWSGEHLFLDEVLLLFRDDVSGMQETLKEELAWLSNKVIACEGIDFAAEDRVRHGIERARSFVSIGLELLSGRDLLQAKKILSERWLEIIFRWGATAVLTLREEAFEIVRDYWKGERAMFLEFLNPPYGPILKGLLRDLPECYDPQAGEDADFLRDFKAADEIRRIELAVQQIHKVHEILNVHVPDYLQRVAIGKVRETLEPTFFSVLGTLLVNFGLSGKLTSQAVSEKDLREFIKKNFEKNTGRAVLKSDLKQHFQEKMLPAQDRGFMKPLFSLLFENMEEDLSDLDVSAPIDPRFISCLHAGGATSKKSTAKKTAKTRHSERPSPRAAKNASEESAKRDRHGPASENRGRSSR